MTDSNQPGSSDSGPSTQSNLQGLPETVASIVDTMRSGRISRLVLSKGDFHLELESAAPNSGLVVERTTAAASEIEESESHTSGRTVHVITSPMIGTYYSAPAPGEPPFVRDGDRIAQGDTIGIVEAMKIMNEIAADRAGKVIRIVAANGETVEYGSPLIELELQT